MNYFLLSLLTAGSLLGDQQEQQEPEIQVQPCRFEVRHVEPKGIGFSQGYSTLAGFFAPLPQGDGLWVPFVDARGHVFNDGHLAANVGLGVRSIRSIVWGLNAYYDYRQTHRHHYNQVSGGIEALGKVWDFRWNFYLPFGKIHSHFYDTKFHSFRGHYAYFSRKQEFAMKGTHAEVGAHMKAGSHVDFYTAVGPYYFREKGRQAIGGEARLVGKIWHWLNLEFNVSYDSLFKDIFQGVVGIEIPLGPKKRIERRPDSSYTPDRRLYQRAYQNVDKDEIIVASHRKKKEIARNPSTNQPWFFWFVNNTSHSAGTYESPFNTLHDAQNASSADQIIYVFAGDGTTNGMNAGIVLKDNQYFFGSGTAQLLPTTFGTQKIPAQTASMPSMTNSSGLVGIELANHNVVSGFHIAYPGGFTAAIHGDNITGGTILNNVITGISGSGFGGAQGGIGLGNGSGTGVVNGTFVIKNNSFIGNNNKGIGIDLDLEGNANAFFDISRNYFTQLLVGVDHDAGGSCQTTFSIIDNTFENFNSPSTNIGIFLGPFDDAIVNAVIQGNRFLNLSKPFSSGVNLQPFSAGQLSVLIQANTFMNCQTGVVYLPASTTNTSAQILNNTFVGGTDETMINVNGDQNAGTWNASIHKNRLSGNGTGILFVTGGTSPGQLSIDNNQIDSPSQQAINMLIPTGSVVAQLSNNQITNTGGSDSILVETLSPGRLCLSLTDNHCDRPIQLTNTSGTFNVEGPSLSSNTPTPSTSGAVTLVPDGTCH